jgi:putative MATE family efflux protein
VPVLLALFLQAMYGAVDLIIVGQFGGEASDIFVSAVSTGSQITMTLTVIITGLAMGLTVYVGESIGAGKGEKAGEIIGSGITLFTVISLALTVVMVLCSSPLTRLMQAPTEAFDQTVWYIAICSAGTLFIVAYNLVGSIFRGIGDSKIPLLTVAIACVFNILGDYLLVAVFHLGAVGAALATVLAQAISVILSLFIIRKRKFPFVFSLRSLYPNRDHIKVILRLGIPIAFQDLLVSISFLVILAIVNGLGLTASAGVGVAEKVCAFIMLIPSAFMQAMSAFVAQNVGALRYDRAQKALWYGVASSVVVGIAVGYFSFFHGDLLAGIFTADPTIIAAATEYLKSYAIDCVLTAFLFCFMGYFNGCGNTTFVMLQGIIGGIGIRLPVSWAMSKVLPVSLFRIGLATPITTAVQILFCAGFYIAVQRERQRNPMQ